MKIISVNRVAAKAGRVWSKKAMKKVINKGENLIHCCEQNRYGRAVQYSYSVKTLSLDIVSD